MSSLQKVKSTLLENLRKEDVSQYVPSHDAFEVEDLASRKNYAFVLDREKRVVRMHNTSRGSGNNQMTTINETSLPFDLTDVVEYYSYLYRKALHVDGGVAFLGYVDPVNFFPLEEEQPT
jgi:hypothetical protein